MNWRRAIRLIVALTCATTAILTNDPPTRQIALAVGADVDTAWNSGEPFPMSTVGIDATRRLAVSDDGSTYVVGEQLWAHGPIGIVSKLGTDGHVDPVFGTRLIGPEFDGTFLSQIGGAAVLPDGSLAIAGSAGGEWAIAIMSSSGELEALIHLSHISGQQMFGLSPPTLAVAADGSLVLAGSVYGGTGPIHMAIARLHPNGVLDQSFGTGGLVLDPVPPTINGASFVSILPQFDNAGRVLAAVEDGVGGPHLIRLTATGALDASFATGGVLDEADGHVPTLWCRIGFVVDAHDRIITVCVEATGAPGLGLRRYLPDGRLDTSFGDGGTARVVPSAGGRILASGESVRMDGERIILAGRTTDSTTSGSATDFAVWRFTTNGRLDRSFGAVGGVVRRHDGISDGVDDLAVGAGGRITLLVSTDVDNTASFETHSEVVRLLPQISSVTPPLALLDTPVRVLDTRLGIPGGAARLAAGNVLTLPLAGRSGVAADASAVILNVTVTEPAGPGFVTVFPCGQPPPVASNLNYVAGQSIPNLIIAKLGVGGAVCIFTSQTTDLVADLSGSYGIRSDLHPLPTPLRLIDTRIALGWILPSKIGPGSFPGLGPLGGPVIGSAVRSTSAGVPNGADAGEIVLNVTITEPDQSGFLTVYPCGTSVPLASNLNFTAGETIANLVTVRMTPTAANQFNPRICFLASTRTHLVVDLEATIDIGAADVTLPNPTRVLDTRSGNGAPIAKTSPGVPLQLQVLGQPGVGSDAIAVGLNVTATEPDLPGFISVYPCDQPPPVVSNVNFRSGETIPNYVIVRIGTGGKVCMVSNTSTHIVADLTEFFTPVS